MSALTITKQRGIRFARIFVTWALFALGALVLYHLYDYYAYSPQTRDGKVSADIVPLAADVSGQVTRVFVHDNETVERGQILFEVDRERLANALVRADATVETARAQLAAARREDRRYRSLEGVASGQDIDMRRSALETAAAAYDQARADRELARINLTRSQVRSPVAGTITNFSLRPGTYASAGQPVMAIIDRDSFYVAGYFEETKLRNVHLGTVATLRIMGEPQPLQGHVASLSAGIDDRERTTAAGTLLANVNPTFTWIRLAQRVPVRIAIDRVPPGVSLIAGRTVTVSLAGADAALNPAHPL